MCVCVCVHIYISEVGKNYNVYLLMQKCKNKLIRYDTRKKVKTMTEHEQHDK